jgi:hypothetical protein
MGGKAVVTGVRGHRQRAVSRGRVAVQDSLIAIVKLPHGGFGAVVLLVYASLKESPSISPARSARCLHETEEIAHQPDFFLHAGDSGEGQGLAIRRPID